MYKKYPQKGINSSVKPTKSQRKEHLMKQYEGKRKTLVEVLNKDC